MAASSHFIPQGIKFFDILSHFSASCTDSHRTRKTSLSFKSHFQVQNPANCGWTQGTDATPAADVSTVKGEQLKEKFGFLHVKPHNKDIYNHTQCATACALKQSVKNIINACFKRHETC